jgi:hypothetical protein
MGTRRLEEMITDARAQAYSEDYSLTEGWDDNVVARLFNLGLNRLYHAITQIDNPANIEEFTADIVSGQQSYDIPIHVFMAIRIMDVRYQWGTQAYEFTTLKQGMIQDRFSYPINIPDTYCIRDGKILLSPTPNLTKSDALIVNFQKRMRSVDVRRGLLASKTDSPVTITLSFTSTSSKNANMQTNAESLLDKIDYICLVDREGEPIVSQIPVNNYNSSTKVITAETTYSFPTAELAALDAAIAAGTAVYVVSGSYASTHSELDTQCEDYLIEFVIARLLRLQSNQGEMQEAKEREREAMNDLVNAYRRYRESVYPVRWVNNFRRSSFPFGRRGIF